MEPIKFLYESILEYAKEHHLKNTELALKFAMDKLYDSDYRSLRSGISGENCLHECMKSAKMLKDLHIVLSQDETDTLLAAMICHDVLAYTDYSADINSIRTKYPISSPVWNLVKLITRPENMNEEIRMFYYKNIQERKLAVLAVLADRSDYVEQISELPIAEVNDFILEMRNFLLPMCMYALQHYGECHMAIKVMMEKIRCLMDVADIISSRYKRRESMYASEILSLMEENARLRGMIYDYKQGGIRDRLQR